ncbi:MAG: pyrroline-5-carboxylate reductase [Polaromonas sp.]|nr:pyrroline-5-carboxylate reductase [Polaromonas sp.]
MTSTTETPIDHIAFIGGGNMASAIIGGLLRRGMSAAQLLVVEPLAAQREALTTQFGVQTASMPDEQLTAAALVVWAVKPQTFRDAAAAASRHTRSALHLSVAAGIRSDSMARWLGTERVVRCMPNTPALIGKGITGLFARSAVSQADRLASERVITTTGDFLWLPDEAQLDAVTALSGSGPAYVFYFLEAMTQAGIDMGLPADAAAQLAIGTFTGASALAASSTEAPGVLRARVTSQGGTTDAAIKVIEQADIGRQFQRAIHAARQRARDMGDKFGAD